MDKYVVELSKILNNLEESLNLTIEDRGGNALKNAPCLQVVSILTGFLEDLDVEDRKCIAVSVGKQVALLSYVNDRLNFFERKKLDFTIIPCMTDVVNILLLFVTNKGVRSNNSSKLDSLMALMDEIDESDVSAKSSLSYRFIRLFLILYLYGLYSSASVIARFLLEQIILQ